MAPPPGGAAGPPGGGLPPGGPPPGAGGPPALPAARGSYSVGNAFSYAFKKFQENLVPLILITLILAGRRGDHPGARQHHHRRPSTPDLTFNFETGEYEGGGGGFFGISMILSFLFGALSFAVNLVIQSGIIKASLALTRGQKVEHRHAPSAASTGPRSSSPR